MNSYKLVLSTRSDLARMVKGECGEDICSEVEFVTATAPNGERWAHPTNFEVVSIGYCPEDCFPFAYHNKEQQAALDQLLADLKAKQQAGTLSLDRWSEIDPVYGSDAWGSEDEYELARLDYDERY